MKVFAAARPFVLTSLKSGWSLALTSEETQRVLDLRGDAIVRATPHRVVLIEDVVIRPASLGGGPAFTIER